MAREIRERGGTNSTLIPTETFLLGKYTGISNLQIMLSFVSTESMYELHIYLKEDILLFLLQLILIYRALEPPAF